MRNFDHNLSQLKLCEIKGGTWIDAGCGYGTYTFPLSQIASKVIAIDNDVRNIESLKTQIKKNKRLNIEVIQQDFNSRLYHSTVDGVLFAFSLHYQHAALVPIKIAYQQLNLGGKILIFEYSRSEPLPWIPYPKPISRITSILIEIGFSSIKKIYENHRYYILRGAKE